MIKGFFKLIKYILIFIVIKYMIEQVDISDNNFIENIIDKIEHTINTN